MDKQRERLVELIISSVNGCARNWAEVIADYLLANGVIVPPLKMGYRVWIIDWCYEINCYEVSSVRYREDRSEKRFSYDALMVDKNNADIGFDDSDIGKTVFLTKEEAEAKLKEGEQG